MARGACRAYQVFYEPFEEGFMPIPRPKLISGGRNIALCAQTAPRLNELIPAILMFDQCGDAVRMIHGTMMESGPS